MSDPQLVSTDPNWTPVSTDPNWQGDTKPVPSMSAAMRGTALPAVETPNDAAFLRTFGLHGTAGIDVTYDDLAAHPVESMQKIGAALKADATDPRVWLNLAAAYFGPKVIAKVAPVVVKAMRSASATSGKVASAAVDALDPDLVSIASPRAGAVLRKAQQVKAAMQPPPAATVAVPEAVVVAPAEPVPAELPRDLTRRLKAENQARLTSETAAPAPVPTAAPTPGAAPPAATAADPAALWRNLRAAGLSPTEAQTAARLLGQGVKPAEVEARILAARPSAPSVPDLSPIQKAVNIKPGVEPSTAQVTNGLGLAARRAKVTLSADDLELLRPLVKQGMAPEEAIQGLPALKMQSIPGTMTDEQVAAEIAARVGNRSPKRD